MVGASNSFNNNDNDDSVMDSIVPKSESFRDISISSSISTPDAEAEAEAEALGQDVAQVHKRKGGRKPIYATSEERKQRNRQAQAAFRERRTEYIRHLEATIKRNEDNLQSLQRSHRTAADECLMLRYKNSLLERILLEKGINVQAELQLKSDNPGAESAKPSFVPPKPMSTADHDHHHPPTPTTTTTSTRTHTRNPSHHQRFPSGVASKSDQFGMSTQHHRHSPYGIPSPQFHPTPSSHASSPPHIKSPRFPFQNVVSPVGVSVEPRSQMLPQPRSFAQTSPPLRMSQPESMVGSKPILPNGAVPMAPRGPGAYYTSPFQRHYDQLDQEYDAQADIVDEPDNHNPSPYSATGFNNAAATGPHPHSMGTNARGLPNFNTPQPGEGANGVYGGSAATTTNQLMGPYEPILDADPFGLSASMHFQTPFSYEQNNARH